MSALEELSSAVKNAAEKVGPSVVAVNRSGAGIVIGENLVLTNAHNLRGDEALVQFADGRWVKGSVSGADPDGDLAVLAVETGDAPAVSWSEKPAELGQVVVALANPRGHGMRATVGTVSSLGRSFRGPRGRRIAGGLEHTAPLGRGSSGGPVVDAEGRVLGVNTHRMQEGFYLAVSSDEELRSRIDNLAAGKTPARRRLGASIAPPQAARHLRAAAGLPEVDGLLIRGVEEGGAADRAGIRRGDVIVSVGGEPLSSIDDLYRALDGEGGSLEFGIVRATEEVTVTVDFGG
ncbi:MAG: S1C family serine protease [Acidimicrobiales bacterium]